MLRLFNIHSQQLWCIKYPVCQKAMLNTLRAWLQALDQYTAEQGFNLGLLALAPLCLVAKLNYFSCLLMFPSQSFVDLPCEELILLSNNK